MSYLSSSPSAATRLFARSDSMSRLGPPLPLEEIIAKDDETELVRYVSYYTKAPKPASRDGRSILMQLIVGFAYRATAALLQLAPPKEIDERDSSGFTALHLACANGKFYEEAGQENQLVEIVKKLLSLGASPYANNHERVTPLHIALFQQDSELVQELSFHCMTHREELKEQEAEVFKGGKQTPFHIAAAGNPACLEYFIATWSDWINEVDERRKTVLHYSVSSPHYAENTSALLRDKSIKKDEVDLDGNTPLSIACRMGSQGAAGILIDAGVDPNIGTTAPLEDAYFSDCKTIVTLLLESGASPDVKCGKNTLIEISEALNDQETVALLLKHKATQTPSYRSMRSFKEKSQKLEGGKFRPDKELLKVNPESIEQISFLHEYVLREDLDLAYIQSKLKKKDWETTNPQGLTPFLYCCKKGSLLSAIRLLSVDLDQAATDKLGNNALHLALESASPALFYFLATVLKSLINLPNREGKTPLHKALERGNHQAAHHLIRHGANVAMRDAKKNGMLHMLALRSDEEFAKFEPLFNLLANDKKQKLDLDGVNSDGARPLLQAWSKNCRRAFFKLLNLGADPNVPTDDGTLLQKICHAGDYAAAERLVLAGADRNVPGLLLTTCKVKKRDFVKLLLDPRICASKGKKIVAHPNRGMKGETPLIATIKAIVPDADVRAQVAFKIFEDLLHAGADPNLKAKESKDLDETPLTIAVKMGLEPVVEELLNRKARINLKPHGNRSPIKLACKAKMVSIAARLIKAGAKSKELADDPTYLAAQGKEVKKLPAYDTEDETSENPTAEASRTQSAFNSKTPSPTGTMREEKGRPPTAEEISKRLASQALVD